MFTLTHFSHMLEYSLLDRKDSSRMRKQDYLSCARSRLYVSHRSSYRSSHIQFSHSTLGPLMIPATVIRRV